MRQNRGGEPGLFKQFGLFSILVLALSGLVHAQSFEQFKKSQAEAFSSYKDERDAAFHTYLKEQWRAYSAFKSEPLFEKPKPKHIESAKEKKIQSIGPKVAITIKPPQTPVTPKEPQEKEKSLEPKKEVLEQQPPLLELVVPKDEPKQPSQEVKKSVQPEVKRALKKDVVFDFFGQKVGFDIEQKIRSAKFYPTDQKGISHYFDTVASSDYEEILRSIESYKKEMKLNDWGLYQLVTKLSKEVHKQENEANLLSWFLFNKLGYAVKIGLANGHVTLMHYSKKIIYATPNFVFGQKKYYVISHDAKGSVGRLYSYDQDYPEAVKSLDLDLKNLPLFAETIESKKLSFEYEKARYDFTIEYNKNLLDFMATYPQAEYETFFQTPLEERTYRALATKIKSYIDGKRASDAMNFVLQFVQKAFDYERDDQQFGREKVMFAQETLYYNKSDCEDRAVLFAYLMQELFNMNVLGVKYKDHISTALYIPMEGDFIVAGGKKFIVADPTYINANIGQNMPKYRDLKPEKFILVKRD